MKGTSSFETQMWWIAVNVGSGPALKMMPLSVKFATGFGVMSALSGDQIRDLFHAMSALIFPRLIASNALQKERPNTVSAGTLTAGILAAVGTLTIAGSVMRPCVQAVGPITSVLMQIVRMRRVSAADDQ